MPLHPQSTPTSPSQEGTRRQTRCGSETYGDASLATTPRPVQAQRTNAIEGSLKAKEALMTRLSSPHHRPRSPRDTSAGNGGILIEDKRASLAALAGFSPPRTFTVLLFAADSLTDDRSSLLPIHPAQCHVEDQHLDYLRD